MTAGYSATPWSLRAPIQVDDEPAGEVAVYYLEDQPVADEGPFLKEERKLLDEYLAEQDAPRTGAGTQPLREGET